MFKRGAAVWATLPVGVAMAVLVGVVAGSWKIALGILAVALILTVVQVILFVNKGKQKVTQFIGGLSDDQSTRNSGGSSGNRSDGTPRASTPSRGGTVRSSGTPVRTSPRRQDDIVGPGNVFSPLVDPIIPLFGGFHSQPSTVRTEECAPTHTDHGPSHSDHSSSHSDTGGGGGCD